MTCRLVIGRAHSEPDGTRWRTGGEVKGKLANGVGCQYSHATSERGLPSITQADAHTSAASSRLNWRPNQIEWTRPFRGKTKSGFCACAITFRTSYTSYWIILGWSNMGLEGVKSDTLRHKECLYNFSEEVWRGKTSRTIRMGLGEGRWAKI